MFEKVATHLLLFFRKRRLMPFNGTCPTLQHRHPTPPRTAPALRAGRSRFLRAHHRCWPVTPSRHGGSSNRPPERQQKRRLAPVGSAEAITTTANARRPLDGTLPREMRPERRPATRLFAGISTSRDTAASRHFTWRSKVRPCRRRPVLATSWPTQAKQRDQRAAPPRRCQAPSSRRTRTMESASPGSYVRHRKRPSPPRPHRSTATTGFRRRRRAAPASPRLFCAQHARPRDRACPGRTFVPLAGSASISAGSPAATAIPEMEQR